MLFPAPRKSRSGIDESPRPNIGVHASDSAHAWQSIALSANTGNKNAALVLAG